MSELPPTLLHPLSVAAKPRLLIVDDQPINIQVLHRIFAGDYQVFMASSGQQGIHVCKTKLPDLVLLDIEMPDMDGYEVCRRLKADPTTCDIPIMFVTAHSDAERETLGLELGAVDFLTKPVVPAVVKARVRTHITLKRQSDILRNMAFLDGLLGLFNRRYFDQQLQTEWARAHRSGAPLSVIILDVDHFKRFNDTYGHLAGDDCLLKVAASLRASLRRPGDVVARYGGEEFACILAETDLEQAMYLAQTQVQNVRQLSLPHQGSDVADIVTISAGVCCHLPGSGGSIAGLVSKADALLYRAKRNGRDQVAGGYLDPTDIPIG